MNQLVNVVVDDLDLLYIYSVKSNRLLQKSIVHAGSLALNAAGLTSILLVTIFNDDDKVKMSVQRKVY